MAEQNTDVITKVIPKNEQFPEIWKDQYKDHPDFAKMSFINEDDEHPFVDDDDEGEIVEEEQHEDQHQEEQHEEHKEEQHQEEQPKGLDFKKYGFENEEQLEVALKEYKEFKNKKPEPSLIDDEELLRLNILKNKKPDEYPLYRRLVLGNMSDLDVIRLEIEKQYPELKDNPKKIDILIKKKYQGYFPTKDTDGEIVAPDPESDEYQSAEVQMMIDAKTAKRNLLKDFNEIQLPKKTTPQDVEKENTELASKWSESFHGDIVPNLKSIVIEDKDLKDFEKFEVPIPEEMQKELKGLLADYIMVNKLQPSAESTEVIKSMAYDMAWALNKKAIQKALIEKRDAYWQKKNNVNYHGVKRIGTTQTAQSEKKDLNEQEQDKAMAEFRKKGG